MPDWTSVAELYRYLRRPAPAAGSDEEAEAEQALEAAERAIEDEAGQKLGSSTDTVILDGPGGTDLVLPRWPVTGITSITLVEDSTVLVEGFDEDYTWSEAGIVEYLAGWPTELRSIEVVFTAGDFPVPISLRRIAWRLASTEEVNQAGVESEKIGDYSVKYRADVIAGELTAADRRLISRYSANR